MSGEIGILNVGTGDTKLVFDKNNPEDCARAARTLTDMMRRGYAILIECGTDPKSGEKLYRRAKGFDPETCEYIIAGDADVAASTTTEGSHEQSSRAPARAEGRKERGSKPRESRVAASSARGVAVARTAGG